MLYQYFHEDTCKPLFKESSDPASYIFKPAGYFLLYLLAETFFATSDSFILPK